MNETIVTTVSLRAIRAKPEEFSPRQGWLDTGHARKLAGILKDGATLPPLDVWQAAEGAPLVVLDGHHRRAAYKLAKRQDDVPVRVHRGSLVAALMVASRENGKLRLSLSNTERVDWAWRLERMAEAARNVTAGERSRDEKEAAELSLARIARAAGVSKSTVATMRAMARKATAEAGFAATGSWALDQRTLSGADMTGWTDEEADARRACLVAEIAEALGKALKPHLGRKPDIVAEALTGALGRRLGEVTRILMGEVDEFREVLAEMDAREF